MDYNAKIVASVFTVCYETAPSAVQIRPQTCSVTKSWSKLKLYESLSTELVGSQLED